MTEILQDGATTIICLDAEYDALNESVMQSAQRTLLQAAEGQGTPRLVLDFSRTKYLGSNFIELLVRVAKRVRQRQGLLAVCELNPFCREVLEVSRLTELLPVHVDRASAVASVSAQ